MRNMMRTIALFLVAAAAQAQHANSPQTLATPIASTPATDLNNPETQTMIANRARVFANRISGSETSYIYVTSADLKGLTPAQVQAALTPAPVTAGEKVRTVDIVVDLRHPLVVAITSSAPVSLGTVTVSGTRASSNLTVNTDIAHQPGASGSG